MVKKILIANRGEIAIRVIRACRELGIKTVAVYSEVDKDSLHVRLADEAVCVGKATAGESYLHKQNIVTAAIVTHSEAIHPGFGFLSENAEFAALVKEAGLIFIGPSSELIATLGDKVEARKAAKKFNLPITPGSEKDLSTVTIAKSEAARIGYPVMLKSAAGGGGRGIRIVRSESELEHAYNVASKEAKDFFSDGTLYLEKFLENPRHVEMQLIGDGAGHAIHIGERDCSMQHNHQKLIEETPSPVMKEATRQIMYKTAVKLFAGLSYCGAGTIEFLLDGDNFYLMEINTRIQVEHPVSEMVSRVDIIREQILAAVNNKLTLKQEDIHFQGHSIECRVTAKTTGTVSFVHLPGGPEVRVDTYLESGAVISPYYDPMIAKVIVWAPTRDLAIKRMERALDEFDVQGIETNAKDQRKLLGIKEFVSNNYNVHFYDGVYSKRQENK